MAGLIVLSASGNSGESATDQRHTSPLHIKFPSLIKRNANWQEYNVMRIDFMTSRMMQTLMIVYLAQTKSDILYSADFSISRSNAQGSSPLQFVIQHLQL